ncbi:hypothetical protein [Paracoccus marcusii]|uniref:hypothetical protein n=1 Tax=Paracoccus marcusii TaxID=59779 RepID=UPI003267A8A0
MNEPDYPDLSISQSCKRLSIARSSISYTPKGGTEQNLGLMRRIGSKPPVLVYWQKYDINRPDPQVQRVT